jgi:hypothetical protein
MKKVTLWYDWWDGPDPLKQCQAAVEMPHGIILFGYGASWQEAKTEVLRKARSLPPDEEVEL